MQVQEARVSVIIPMHNVERNIDRCLHCLTQLGAEAVEVLFVDDCSTDGTVQKVSRWMEAHSSADLRCRILRHRQNKGVAAARNTGLDNATGQYIYYIDADDYVEPGALGILLERAGESGADIVGCEWYLAFRQNERHMQQPDASTGDELFQRMAKGRMRWNLWLFLVRRSLYEENGIRFMPGMNMGEDMMAMMKLSLHAGKVCILHQPLYHYIQTNSQSLTKQFLKARPQVTANVRAVEAYLAEAGREDLCDHVRLLQLSVKLPLLISPKTEDYRTWAEWFPESNAYVGRNDENPFYIRLIERAAQRNLYCVLRLYYWIVIRVLYGLIYK